MMGETGTTGNKIQSIELEYEYILMLADRPSWRSPCLTFAAIVIRTPKKDLPWALRQVCSRVWRFLTKLPWVEILVLPFSKKKAVILYSYLVLHVRTFCCIAFEFSKPAIPEEPFDLKVGTPVSSLPPEVIRRRTGKQSPVAPHAQRLLVAHAKEAKAELKGSGKGNKGTGKGKGKSKGKGKGKADKVNKKTNPKAKAKAKADPKPKAEPKQKSPYASAKAVFMDKFPV